MNNFPDDKKVYEEKLTRFREGRYSFPAPPVTTTYWTEKDWISFIDKHGIWHYCLNNRGQDNENKIGGSKPQRLGENARAVRR
jgi:hypothetical protein